MAEIAKKVDAMSVKKLDYFDPVDIRLILTQCAETVTAQALETHKLVEKATADFEAAMAERDAEIKSLRADVTQMMGNEVELKSKISDLEDAKKTAGEAMKQCNENMAKLKKALDRQVVENDEAIEKLREEVEELGSRPPSGDMEDESDDDQEDVQESLKAGADTKQDESVDEMVAEAKQTKTAKIANIAGRMRKEISRQTVRKRLKGLEASVKELLERKDAVQSKSNADDTGSEDAQAPKATKADAEALKKLQVQVDGLKERIDSGPGSGIEAAVERLQEQVNDLESRDSPRGGGQHIAAAAAFALAKVSGPASSSPKAPDIGKPSSSSTTPSSKERLRRCEKGIHDLDSAVKTRMNDLDASSKRRKGHVDKQIAALRQILSGATPLPLGDRDSLPMTPAGSRPTSSLSSVSTSSILPMTPLRMPAASEGGTKSLSSTVDGLKEQLHALSIQQRQMRRDAQRSTKQLQQQIAALSGGEGTGTDKTTSPTRRGLAPSARGKGGHNRPALSIVQAMATAASNMSRPNIFQLKELQVKDEENAAAIEALQSRIVAVQEALDAQTGEDSMATQIHESLDQSLDLMRSSMAVTAETLRNEIRRLQTTVRRMRLSLQKLLRHFHLQSGKPTRSGAVGAAGWCLSCHAPKGHNDMPLNDLMAGPSQRHRLMPRNGSDGGPSRNLMGEGHDPAGHVARHLPLQDGDNIHYTASRTPSNKVVFRGGFKLPRRGQNNLSSLNMTPTIEHHHHHTPSSAFPSSSGDRP